MLDEVTLRALDSKTEMSPAGVIADLDSVQTAVLSDTAISKRLQLETRRRVAERKLSVLSERSLPFDYIGALLEEVRRLGYTNLDIEGRIEVIFARYCIREGYKNEAKDVLERLLKRIPEAPPEEEVALAQMLRDLCKKLLAELV